MNEQKKIATLIIGIILTFVTPLLIIHVAKHLFGVNWHHRYWDVFLFYVITKAIFRGWMLKNES